MPELNIPYQPISASALVLSQPMDGVHPQQAFHQDRGKKFYRAALAGTGGGKSAAGAFEIIRNAIEFSGTAWAAYEPTFPMVRDIMLPAIKRLLGNDFTRCPLVSGWNQTEKIMELVNGSTIRFGSMEHPERAEGPNLDGVWLDEPRLIRKWMGEDGAFSVLDRRLRGSGANKNCPIGMWLTTSAPTRKIHEMFERKDSEHYLGDEARVYRWTTADNPHTPQRYRDNLLKKYTGMSARRFLYGEFGISEGLALDGFDPTKHVLERDVKWSRITGGVDWGWTNPAAVMLVYWISDEEFHIHEELYGTNLGEEAIRNAVTEADKRLGGIRWRAGHDRPEAINTLSETGVTIEAHRGPIQERMGWVQEASSKGRLTCSPDSVNFVSEAEALQKDPEKDGHVLPGPNHAIDAVTYAIAAGRSDDSCEAEIF